MMDCCQPERALDRRQGPLVLEQGCIQMQRLVFKQGFSPVSLCCLWSVGRRLHLGIYSQDSPPRATSTMGVDNSCISSLPVTCSVFAGLVESWAVELVNVGLGLWDDWSSAGTDPHQTVRGVVGRNRSTGRVHVR